MFRKRLIPIAIAFAIVASATTATAVLVKKNIALPQLPTMVGTGETIKVTPGRWNQKVSLTHQWLLDGRPIKSATKTTYLVPVSALGKKLSVVETAKFSDKKTMFVNSSSKVVGDIKISGAVTITKNAEANKMVLTSPAAPNARITKTINWFASGSLIQGEKGTELVIDERFDSLPVYAKVIFTSSSYKPLVVKSNSVNFAAPEATQDALIWSDEFDGEVGAGPNLDDWHDVTGNGRLNTDQYSIEPTGWGNLERQYYLPGSARIAEMAGSDDGKGLLFTATNQKTDPHPDGPFDCWYSFNWRKQRYDPPVNCDWVSGKITTEGRIGFLYGRLEARIKTTGAAGTWPAFWTLGTDYSVNGWPYCGEIDIHEGNGGIPNKNWGTIHGTAYWPGGDIYRDTSVLAEWHVYAVDWKPDYIAFSVDGEIYKTITAADLTKSPWNLDLEKGGWEFNKPHFAILNLAVGGRMIGNNNLPIKVEEIDPNTKTMQVDYIRYSSLDGYGTLIRY